MRSLINWPETWSDQTRDLIRLFTLALALRFIALIAALWQIGLENLIHLAPDSTNYLNMAQWLLSSEATYPEARFIDWGIGYAAWLGGLLFLLGSEVWIIVIQIILSSASCASLYLICKSLDLSRAVALGAGALLALSLTSISLSIVILSDTLFFFLILAGAIFYFRALMFGKWSAFILAGTLFGCALLTRSVGQFWPLVLLVLAFSWQMFSHSSGAGDTNKSVAWRWRQPLTTALISVLMLTGWVAHNYREHDLMAPTFSGARAAANLAAWTIEQAEGTPAKETLSAWYQGYLKMYLPEQRSWGKHYRFLQRNSFEVFAEYPVATVSVYLKTVRDNVTAINYLQRQQFPDWRDRTNTLEKIYLRWNVRWAETILALIGVIILIARRSYLPLAVLALIYFYFAAMVGGIRWQGSRIFYPGQIAALPLVSIALVGIFSWLRNIVSKRFPRQSLER